MKMASERIDEIKNKISTEKARSIQRIMKIIDRVKDDDMEMVNLVIEEREKSAKKIDQLQNQISEIEQREKFEERKKRTHRLVQIGALAEKYFDCKGIEPLEFEKLLQKMVSRAD